ncbi:MAG TPA: hypothetical protein VFX15_07565 [Actinomycetes bacterium]|nr:hypothetical protein [Actinomycetes bacterium]
MSALVPRLTASSLVTVIVAAIVFALAGPAAGVHNDLQAKLRGADFPAARGLADYDGRHGHDHRALDVKVRNISRLAGRTLVVRVHGVRLGTMQVTSTGRAHLHRHRLFAIQEGWRIRVVTQQSHKVVAIGRFVSDRG